MRWIVWLCLLSSVSKAFPLYAAHAVALKRFTVQISAQPLLFALRELANQTGVTIVFIGPPPPESVMARAVSGPLTVLEIVERLTGEYEASYLEDVEAYGLTLRPPEEVSITAPAVPEVLTSDVLNVDLLRGDRGRGNLPLISFNQDAIQKVGAADAADFLRKVLLNASFGSSKNLLSGPLGSGQQINLRGFGSAQTLVLVDGHPVARLSLGGAALQTNLGSVPAEAIERIDVVPMAASALYGPNAIGGVVNVVLKRDYRGLGASAQLEQIKDASAGAQRLVLHGGGRYLEDTLSLSGLASFEQQAPFSLREQDVMMRGRRIIEARRPGYLDSQSIPPLGASINGRFDAQADACGRGTATPFSIPPGYDASQGVEPLCAHDHYALASAPTAQFGGGDQLSARGETRRGSLIGTLRYQVSPALTADLDLFGSQERRAWRVGGADYSLAHGILWPARVNPWGKDARLTLPTTAADGWMRALEQSWRLASAIQWDLPLTWQVRLSYAWSYSSVTLHRPVLDLDPAAFTSGAVNPLAADLESALTPYVTTWRISPIRATTGHAYLLVSGPITQIRGRAVSTSLALEQRHERSGVRGAVESLAAHSGQPWRAISQLSPRTANITSVAAHAQIPITSKTDIDLHGRWDRYAQRLDLSALGGDEAANLSLPILREKTARAAIGYQAHPLIRLSGSCATAWAPPAFEQRRPSALSLGPRGLLFGVVAGVGLEDPVSIVSGGSTTLGPEHARSCALGIALNTLDHPDGPRRLKSTLSLDYIETDRYDTIYMPVGLLYTDAPLFNLLFHDRIRIEPSAMGQQVIVDATGLNVARQSSGTLNLSARAEWPMMSGARMHTNLDASYNTRFTTQLTPKAPRQDWVGVTSEFALRYQVSAQLVIEHHNWLGGWRADYIPGYRVTLDERAQPDLILSQGGSRVSGQDYHDVFAQWTLGTTTLRAGIQNVFNARPPFDASAPTYASSLGPQSPTTFYVSVQITH